MSYNAPIRDIEFALKEVADLGSVNLYPKYEDANFELVSAILQEAGRFAGEVLAPLNTIGDRHGSQWQEGNVTTPPGWKDAYQRFCDNGWGSLAFDPQFGGQGLPMCVSAAVQEMWHSSNMAFGLCPLLTQGAIEAITHHGSDALKNTYLAKMIEGKWTGTMNLTEPQAGTDLAAVRSRAIPKDDHYLVSGQKIFITYGEHDLSENIIHLVLARTPDAPPGVKGISLFIVPKFLVNDDGSIGRRNDLHCVSIEEKLGIHGSPTAVLSYGDNTGAVGYLIGEENRGLMYMFTMMNLARHAVGVEGYALAERSYQKALAYARERVQGKPLIQGSGFSKTIINHPDIRRLLMLMRSQIEAMRMLSLTCAVAFDLAEVHPDERERQCCQRRGELLTPMVKGWCSEEGHSICSLGVQIHGGMGYIEETGAAQFLRDSRITAIYEGTTAIQANDLVGRKLLRDNGLAVEELISEMRESLEQAKRNSNDVFSAMVEGFEKAIKDIEAVSEWMLQNADSSTATIYAGSVDYLMMFSQIAGGWMMIKSAMAADKALSNGTEELEFYDTKIKLASFYILHNLPRASSLKQTIINGSEAALSLEDTQF